MVNKKGVSVIIGYVLLVVFAIIISAVVYSWLKTYIPGQTIECSDGVSILIKEAKFDLFDSRLNLTLVNNGRFNIAGYIIDAKNSSEEELATIDLTAYLNENYGGISGINYAGAILFSIIDSEDLNNPFEPGRETSHIFDIPEEIGEPEYIRIIPIRFEEIKGKLRFVVCGGARVEHAPTIRPALIVFATSTGGLRGDLGGLQGADTLCNNRAGNANLNGTFVAWLSNNTINAKDRINEGVYALPNALGEPTIKVIGSKADFSTGSILHPINRTEYGLSASVFGGVWTGTDEFGNAVPNLNCAGWTSNTGSGTRGRTIAQNKDWTNYNTETCNDAARRIYCFQVTS